MTLEVLPQTGTRGEPLPAGLALVRLVASVDPLVVNQVPLRLKIRILVTNSGTASALLLGMSCHILETGTGKVSPQCVSSCEPLGRTPSQSSGRSPDRGVTWCG